MTDRVSRLLEENIDHYLEGLPMFRQPSTIIIRSGGVIMQQGKLYKVGEFAKEVGVSVKTLQRWDREGILKAFRTPTGRRYYTLDHYNAVVHGYKMAEGR